MIDFLKSLHPDIRAAAAEDWMWNTRVSPVEEQFISKAVEKRCREFRAGRHAAHKVLKQLGHPHFDLKVGGQRQPLWPAGIIGSISHTQGCCICIASPVGELISIGVDVEPLTPVDEASLPLICSRKELSDIERLQPDSPVPLCKLIFSAKESVHKVYHPLNGHTLDFLDAEVSFDLNRQTFMAQILHPEKSPHHPISFLKGHFSYDDAHIFSAILKTRG